MQFNIPAEHKHASGVYIIRNSVNSKVYVGSAVNFRKRFYKHCHSIRKGQHNSVHLQRHADKHGIGTLSFEVLQLCEASDLREQEQDWLNKMLAIQVGVFNSNLVIVSRPDSISRITVECPECGKEINCLKKWPQKFCSNACSAKHYGRGATFTPERRARISQALTGRVCGPLSTATKDKISTSLKGGTVSNATKQKMSAAAQARGIEGYANMLAAPRDYSYLRELRVPRVERRCLACGEAFLVIGSSKKKHCNKRCSRQGKSLSHEARRKVSEARTVEKIDKVCCRCGELFKTYPISSQIFCGRLCADKEKRVKVPRTKCACAHCGIEFTSRPSKIRIFCSRLCSARARVTKA
jgi:group I intron endonuclease